MLKSLQRLLHIQNVLHWLYILLKNNLNASFDSILLWNQKLSSYSPNWAKPRSLTKSQSLLARNTADDLHDGTVGPDILPRLCSGTPSLEPRPRWHSCLLLLIPAERKPSHTTAAAAALPAAGHGALSVGHAVITFVPSSSGLHMGRDDSKTHTFTRHCHRLAYCLCVQHTWHPCKKNSRHLLAPK